MHLEQLGLRKPPSLFWSLLRAYGKAGNGNGNGNGKLKWNSCMVVSNHWTGLTQTTSFSVGQKLNVLIQFITCSWAWSGIFPWVSRGQRSSAYLISCNEKEHIFGTEPIPSLDWSIMETELCHQLLPWSSFVKAHQICTSPLTYTDSRKDAWPGSGASSRHV